MKGKGQKQYGEYIFIYSGVNKDERAREGAAIALHNKYKDCIGECQYISSRILTVKLHIGDQELYMISAYAPEDNKMKQVREEFYDQSQGVVESIPQRKPVIMLGDFNARIGNEVLPGIKQRFNEDVLNYNGELLVNMCALNELRINNTFFDHKPQYKYTFSNTRGQQSMIDYIITNRCLQPLQILDVRTLNSANIGSDHKLLLGKIKIKLKPHKNTGPTSPEEKINVGALWNESTTQLYQQRLKEKIKNNPLVEKGDINNSWDKLRRNIMEAANEALGTRKVIPGKAGCNRTPWFCEKVKEQCKRKKKAYLKYRTTLSVEDHEEYKRIRNITRALVRQVKNGHWETFSKRMESDFYGLQKQIWRLIRNQRKEACELISSNRIPKDTWVNYLKELYKKQQTEFELSTPEIIINNDIILEKKKVKQALKQLRNRKSAGPEGITNELLKYGGESLTEQLKIMINNILHITKYPTNGELARQYSCLRKEIKKYQQIIERSIFSLPL
ncbi:uncharacterized protein LOC123310378 [Coccinella septempunctata]|uniref:uncharacterized protein LOC123310378 n=1 Tax=Coccinella septempunctata TaxID=41139 RepID=UPI001D092CAC|nr:uncharacterized protein LOC123310378 [Coccinella septempunctata]